MANKKETKDTEKQRSIEFVGAIGKFSAALAINATTTQKEFLEIVVFLVPFLNLDRKFDIEAGTDAFLDLKWMIPLGFDLRWKPSIPRNHFIVRTV